nr:transposase [Micromonospora parastrephiae]
MIAPLLSEPGSSQGRWWDHRQVINGILWKLRTGGPWRDLATRYAKRTTLYRSSLVLIAAVIWLHDRQNRP